MTPLPLLLGVLAAFFFSPALLLGKRLAGQGLHLLLLQDNGEVYGTGLNSAGQLGVLTGASKQADTPQLIHGASAVVDMSVGTAHSCFVSNNSASCIGNGDYGQLGRGKYTSSGELVSVIGLEAGVQQVYCRYYGSMAIMAGTGEVWVWGQGLSGQPKYPSDSSMATPERIAALVGVNVTQVSMGMGSSCFLTDAGRVLCRGENHMNQLGTGNNTAYAEPVPVDLSSSPSSVKFASISSGERHTCAVSADDEEVYCWGNNQYRQQGNSTNANVIFAPSKVPELNAGHGVIALWATDMVTIAVQGGGLGEALAIGYDSQGWFGTGKSNLGVTVKAVAYGQRASGIVEFAGGLSTTICMLNAKAQVWCAGANSHGQFGVGAGVVASSNKLVKMRPASPSVGSLPSSGSAIVVSLLVVCTAVLF